MTTTAIPNHHHDHPGFSGISGYLAGLSMIAGRTDVARMAMDAIRLSPDDRLVDVGCGPGVATRVAAKRGAKVIGVDPAAPMLQLARLRPVRGASWREGTAEQLPIDDGWATALWSISTVHHWQDVHAGLAEARRVLAPGGRLLAIERRRHEGAHGLASHGWTDAQADAFAALCETAGFVAARVECRGGRLLVLARSD